MGASTSVARRFAANLLEARERANLSQEEVAFSQGEAVRRLCPPGICRAGSEIC